MPLGDLTEYGVLTLRTGHVLTYIFTCSKLPHLIACGTRSLLLTNHQEQYLAVLSFIIAMTSAEMDSTGRKLLCLTMVGYMKAGITEQDLYEFQVKNHAQLVSGLMKKYGVVRYTIVCSVRRASNSHFDMKQDTQHLSNPSLVTKAF